MLKLVFEKYSMLFMNKTFGPHLFLGYDMYL